MKLTHDTFSSVVFLVTLALIWSIIERTFPPVERTRSASACSLASFSASVGSVYQIP
jgi:hypothetical protein